MAKELTRIQKIEQTITKKYRRYLWSKFQIAIMDYDMIQPGDKIAVCISGGKDSMLLAKMMQMYQRWGMADFECTYMVMDPGYNAENRAKIEKNLEILGIDAVIFNSDIFEIANNTTDSPCYLCARMRRGALYNKARELGCNKIALGHHLNDVIETTVMAMCYSSKLETIIPKSISKNYGEMSLIRPLYCIKEEYINKWVKANDLEFIQCACRFTESNANTDHITSKRLETKNLIAELRKTNPEVEDNIFRALHAVQIETFPGYKKNGKLHSFLEDYGKEEESGNEQNG